ncbi:NAD(P)H-dependent glycerol-3-phosphate dehydrogenase [Aerococcaceae bacterium NML171108]|nr:NAD(P)H-dependent glycerol-3-phosphate dehydrogenase [Aerococcaceae bacterium NML171108]
MKIGVIGTGSWGTALAKVLVENAHHVLMWGRDEDVIAEINHMHTNHRYLPAIELPTTLEVTNDLKAVVQDADVILIVVPTKAVRSVAQQLNKFLPLAKQPLVVHATKGLEPETHLRISQVIEAELSRELYQELVVLSGPSHAEEVARRDVTTLTAASQSLAAAEEVQRIFMNQYFRVYTNTDVIGVELGAALKNIIALGAGILHGAGYGDNAKAALVTRGLTEISRLGVKMGADPLTFIGLSGVGDLVVTCTSPHSRNWQAGNLLARGASVAEVEGAIQMVVEGVATCKVAHELAQSLGVEMPITEALYSVLYEQAQIPTALKQLMSRDGKREASLEGTLDNTN